MSEIKEIKEIKLVDGEGNKVAIAPLPEEAWDSKVVLWRNRVFLRKSDTKYAEEAPYQFQPGYDTVKGS